MNAWTFCPARDSGLSGLDRNRSLLREDGMTNSFMRFLVWTCLRPLLRLWHRPHISGLENLPPGGPFILVSNHTSHLDGIMLAYLLPTAWRDHVYPVAASDTFFESRTMAAFAARFMNALAIRRRGTHNHDLQELRRRLMQGGIFIVFPEGTRSRTGQLQAFRSGIGRLVARSPIPVVPCYLEGCFRACPPGSHFSKPVRIRIHVGKPLQFDHVSDDRDGWDAISGSLKEAVQQLAR